MTTAHCTGWVLEPDFFVDEGGAICEGPVTVGGGGPTVRLPGRMLLPGFVNAHSHSFQRALRGRVEQRSLHAPEDSFWSWRDAMYRDASRLTLDDIEALATWAYLDMLRAGFVAVGEFHYLHHDVAGRPCGIESSMRIARAAEKTGIRATLLQTAYARAGYDLPARPEQARFVFAAVDDFRAHAQAAARIPHARLKHGLAIHSVRACPRAWIEAVADMAKDGRPLHVHAAEQRAEIAQCQVEHGMGPIALLAAAGALRPNTTLVHATHIGAHDVALIAAAGSAVCICPSTERNLGDGLCPTEELARAGVSLCVGSDQHARIDPVDELRSLEDHERLRTERRCVLIAPGGRLGPTLIPYGTRAGRRALDLPPGDWIAVRTPPEGRAGDPAFAVDAFLIGGSGADVTDVFIDGERVVQDGRPTRLDAEAVEAAAIDVLKRLVSE